MNYKTIISSYHLAEEVFSQISIEMEIQKPRTISKVVNKTEKYIYYLIGEKHEKPVSLIQLSRLILLLHNQGYLNRQNFATIAGNSAPCTITTLKWIVKHFRLTDDEYRLREGVF